MGHYVDLRAVPFLHANVYGRAEDNCAPAVINARSRAVATSPSRSVHYPSAVFQHVQPLSEPRADWLASRQQKNHRGQWGRDGLRCYRLLLFLIGLSRTLHFQFERLRAVQNEFVRHPEACLYERWNGED